jgi:salicylate hydroxylase
LVGDGDPVVSGHTIYRAVIDMECVPLELRATRVTLWAAEDWHFVHYPIAGGAKLNLAITRDDGAVDAISGEAVTDRVVLDSFRHAHPEVRQLLGLGRNWRKWVLCSRPRLDDWSDGAVVLVGDAAHPMLQYAAQGASMALEDAVLLARLMPVDVQSVSLAFAELSALRSERAAKVQWVSEEMGRQVYHARDRAQADRNAWLRGFTEQDLRAALGWLHGATEFTESVAERHPARAAS